MGVTSRRRPNQYGMFAKISVLRKALSSIEETLVREEPISEQAVFASAQLRRAAAGVPTTAYVHESRVY
jgi:hypothetical protein